MSTLVGGAASLQAQSGDVWCCVWLCVKERERQNEKERDRERKVGKQESKRAKESDGASHSEGASLSDRERERWRER